MYVQSNVNQGYDVNSFLCGMFRKKSILGIIISLITMLSAMIMFYICIMFFPIFPLSLVIIMIITLIFLLPIIGLSIIYTKAKSGFDNIQFKKAINLIFAFSVICIILCAIAVISMIYWTTYIFFIADQSVGMGGLVLAAILGCIIMLLPTVAILSLYSIGLLRFCLHIKKSLETNFLTPKLSKYCGVVSIISVAIIIPPSLFNINYIVMDSVYYSPITSLILLIYILSVVSVFIFSAIFFLSYNASVIKFNNTYFYQPNNPNYYNPQNNIPYSGYYPPVQSYNVSNDAPPYNQFNSPDQYINENKYKQ